MTINARGAENKRWQWRSKYPNEYYWLVDNYSKFRFARNIYDYLIAHGTLTDKQLDAVRKFAIPE